MCQLQVQGRSAWCIVPANYTTKLGKTLNLASNWEVAVLQVKYKKSWYNVVEGENKFYAYFRTQHSYGAIKLPEGHYESEEDVGRAFTKCIPPEYEIRAEVDSLTKKCTIYKPRGFTKYPQRVELQHN